MKTICLKSEEDKGKVINYFLSSIDKDTSNNIDDLIKKGEEITNKFIRKLVKHPYASIIMVGDGMKVRSTIMEKYVEKFTNRKAVMSNLDRDNIHYRSYEISLEEQLSKQHLVNLCPDVKMSWQSALRKIGYHQAKGLNTPAYYEAYCLIWKTVINEFKE